jgi:5-methyltetrahydropteroyltriglutamate--homocysteine methyltransferase
MGRRLGYADEMRTTVVGSYPVPEWLKTAPGESALRDALGLVLQAQERAGSK